MYDLLKDASFKIYMTILNYTIKMDLNSSSLYQQSHIGCQLGTR